MDNIFTETGRPQFNSDPIAATRVKGSVQILFHTKLPAKIEPICDQITSEYHRKGFHGKLVHSMFYIVHPPSREVLGVQTLQVSCTQRQSEPPKYLPFLAILTNTL